MTRDLFKAKPVNFYRKVQSKPFRAKPVHTHHGNYAYDIKDVERERKEVKAREKNQVVDFHGSSYKLNDLLIELHESRQEELKRIERDERHAKELVKVEWLFTHPFQPSKENSCATCLKNMCFPASCTCSCHSIDNNERGSKLLKKLVGELKQK